MTHWQWRLSLGALVAASCLVISPAFGTTSVDPLLLRALDSIDPYTHIEVSLKDGTRILGDFQGTQEERFLLIGQAYGQEVRSGRMNLEEIDRIRHRKSGAGKGWNTGFTTGAILGGSLFMLWGLAIDSIDGDSSGVGPIVGITLAGTVVGGVGLGLVGSGIGALSTVWHTDYESPRALPPPPEHTESSETRINLGFGLATGWNYDNDYSTTGFFGSAGLDKDLGPRFRFGPELAYYDLGGTTVDHTFGYSYYRSVSPILNLGIAATWQAAGAGWSPLVILGTGYYIGGEGFLGASIGGGLRYRTSSGQDIRLEIRDHINIYDGEDNSQPDNFLTIGANFSFSL
jgi:hypothetical protein